MRPILSYCLICLSLLAGPAAAALPPTNLDLAVQTLEKAVDEALLDLPAGDGIDWSAPIFLSPAARHEANWLVEHVAARRLHAGGRQVAADSSAAAYSLSYRVLDMGVTCQAGLRGKDVSRSSRVTLSLRLSRVEDSALLWNWEKSHSSEDRVPKKHIDLIQHDSYKFAKADIEEQSWGKYIEPVVLTSVLGGLVFLFFSNR